MIIISEQLIFDTPRVHHKLPHLYELTVAVQGRLDEDLVFRITHEQTERTTRCELWSRYQAHWSEVMTLWDVITPPADPDLITATTYRSQAIEVLRTAYKVLSAGVNLPEAALQERTP